MADPQVPADAVQQAQVVLQNQAQEGQAPAALAEQAQAPVAPEELACARLSDSIRSGNVLKAKLRRARLGKGGGSGGNLALSSPRAFFAFLITERLSTTISEPGTGYRGTSSTACTSASASKRSFFGGL